MEKKWNNFHGVLNNQIKSGILNWTYSIKKIFFGGEENGIGVWKAKN